MGQVAVPASFHVSARRLLQVREESTKFRRLLEILGKWYETGHNILIFVNRSVVGIIFVLDFCDFNSLPMARRWPGKTMLATCTASSGTRATLR